MKVGSLFYLLAFHFLGAVSARGSIQVVQPASQETIPLGTTPVTFEAVMPDDASSFDQVRLIVQKENLDGTWTRIARETLLNVSPGGVTVSFSVTSLDATTPSNYRYRIKARVPDRTMRSSAIVYFSTVEATESPTSAPTASPIESPVCDDKTMDFCSATLTPSSCASGVVKLTQNLTCPYYGPGLGAGIELDCDGYSIEGPYLTEPTRGVVMLGIGTTLRNCNIDGFATNVEIYSGEDTLVENVVIGASLEEYGVDITGMYVSSRITSATIRNAQVFSQGREAFRLFSATAGTIRFENIAACGLTPQVGKLAFYEYYPHNRAGPDVIPSNFQFDPSITCSPDSTDPYDACTADLFGFAPLACT